MPFLAEVNINCVHFISAHIYLTSGIVIFHNSHVIG